VFLVSRAERAELVMLTAVIALMVPKPILG
jgi:hypothetical protein